MNKLAIAALSQWDEPQMFEDEEFYIEVNKVIKLVKLHKGKVASIHQRYFPLLTQLLMSSIEATIRAIDSAVDDVKTELINTLAALRDASAELEKNNVITFLLYVHKGALKADEKPDENRLKRLLSESALHICLALVM